MKEYRRLSIVLVLVVIAVAVVGCTRDPNVRKHEYYAKAMRYFRRGRYRAAAIELRNAIKIDPRYADANYQMAQCDLKLGYAGDAYNQLMTTVELAPRNWKAQIDLGYLLYSARQYDKAEAKARLVLEKEPNNADAHALLANAEAALGHHDQALADMKRSVQLEPTSAKYMNLALLESNGQSLADAERDYKKAISLQPRSAVPLLQLGALYARERRFSEAEQEFRRAITLETKSRTPWAMLISLFQAEHQPGRAEQTAAQAKAALKDNPEGYTILGDYYLATGQQQKGTAEYAALYHDHPQNAAIQTKYLGLLLAAGNFDLAAKINAEILKKRPGDTAAMIDRARIQIRQGHAKDAISTLQSVLKPEPDNAAAHYFLGVAYESSGEPELAEREYRTTLRERPNALDAQKAIARLQQQRKDFDGLEKTAEDIIRLAPSSPEGYTYRAIAQAGGGDQKGAEADLKQAIAVDPKSPVGYTAMGDFLVSEKRFQEAEKQFKSALEADPNDIGAVRDLATDYVYEKRPADAIAYMKSQTAKAPNNANYQLILGQLLARQKDYQGAEATLSKAAELSKNNSAVLLVLAQVQSAEGAKDRAAITYEQAIQANPHDVQPYIMLGALEQDVGNWQQAQELYRKALGVQTDNPVAANDLAYVMLGHGGNVDVALSLAQAARQALPDNPGVADTLGLAYYEKGNYELAIELFEEALKKAPNTPDFNYHLAEVYEKTDDKPRAAEYLERVLKLDPNFAKANGVQRDLQALGKS